MIVENKQLIYKFLSSSRLDLFIIIIIIIVIIIIIIVIIIIIIINFEIESVAYRS